jgi:hypothetical protein
MSNLYCLPGRAGGSPGYASWRPGNLPLPDHLSILMQNLKVQQRRWPRVAGFLSPSLAAQRMPAQPKSKTSICSAWNITSETRSTGFGPLGASRFHSVNHSRNGFHRVAPATLEHAVLEPSDTGVYSLQVHAFPALRARRTFGRQQLRQCTAAHGCTRVRYVYT